MPSLKSRKDVLKKHNSETKNDIASFDPSSGVYVCHLCEERHYQIHKKWAPWALPRHLEKDHGYPKEAHTLRMKLIPNWNASFEKEYLENLEKEVRVFESEPEPIEIDPLSNRFKKEEEQNRKEEQETERDSY